jgi:hypothetical protein
MRHRLLCSVLAALPLLAGAGAPPPFLRDDAGAGSKSWIQDPSEAWRGYGAKQGRVWIQTPSGQWRGYGKDQGQSWIRSPGGAWRGYGSPTPRSGSAVRQ